MIRRNCKNKIIISMKKKDKLLLLMCQFDYEGNASPDQLYILYIYEHLYYFLIICKLFANQKIYTTCSCVPYQVAGVR